MTTINTQIEINAPVEQVFKFYTNPDNIKDSWPSDTSKNQKMYQVKKVKKALR